MLDLLVRRRHGRRRHRRAARRRRRRRRATAASSRVGTVDEAAPRAPSTPTGSSCARASSTSTRTTTRRLLWDPTASPSPLHGVTTVLGGNCGFSIAPLAPDDVDYVMRMMARVEGMPLDALEAAADVGLAHASASTSTASTAARRQRRLPRRPLDAAPRRDGRRRHERRRDRRSSRGDGARSLHESLAAGALGFSSSLGEAHTDGDGQPVPSRAAERRVRRARRRGPRPPGHDARVHPRRRARSPTTASSSWPTCRSPPTGRSTGTCSAASRRREIYEQQLTSSDLAAAHGRHVVALALPDVMRMRSSRMLRVTARLARGGRARRRRAARARSPIPRCARRCAPVADTARARRSVRSPTST